MELAFREWLIDFGDSGYVVLYRYDGETAVILAVRHQREAGFADLPRNIELTSATTTAAGTAPATPAARS